MKAIAALGRICDLCYGKSGAVRGNGNIVEGLVVCDYCCCKPKDLLYQEIDVRKAKNKN